MTSSLDPSDSFDMPLLVITRSTELLEQTARVCEYALAHPTPPLDKTLHATFLSRLGLAPQLSRGFVGLDASRTWIMYWVLCTLKLLGKDITPHRQRFVLWKDAYTGQSPV
jgi:hypothetical protein